MTVRLVSNRSGVAPLNKKSGNTGHLRLVPPALPSKAPLWTLEPHVCRCCFARLVSCDTEGGIDREYLCTNCGARAEAESPAALCSCGIKMRRRNASGRSGGPLVDAGIRCMANPNPTPEFPSLFVAGEQSAADAVAESRVG